MGLKKNFHALQKEFLEGLRKVTEEKIEKGALIETLVSEEEGLTFIDGRKQKPKKLIIINVDRENNVCYGALLVNSKMNPKAGYSDEYMSSQYLLKQEDYPSFLRYDSYADCSEIFRIPIVKLLSGEYFEKLKEEDLNGIFDILETSDILTTKEKKRFGIKRR